MLQFGDAEHCTPILLGNGSALWQELGLDIHIQHAGRVFGALGVTGHLEQMISGAA